MDYRSDYDVESKYSGKISLVPSQRAIVSSLCGMLSRVLKHGICLVHRETFLTVHVQKSIRHRHLIKVCFTLSITVLQAKIQCETVQGDLSLEVKNEIEILFQRRALQGDRQP